MRYAALSDIGLKREKNEDSWNIVLDVDQKPVGFVVADGMGGHFAGEKASRIAVEEVSSIVLKCLQKSCIEDCRTMILACVEGINEKIMAWSAENLGGLKSGTTLSLGILFMNELHITHIGDCRVYVLREGRLRQLTEDHSYVNELIRGGLITSDEAHHHPDKNKITRALGFKDSFTPDFYREPIMDGDVFLFCTDGLYENIEDHEIQGIISRSTPEEAASQLINLANERGGYDNITVILVWIQD